jgi:hypothetical protein
MKDSKITPISLQEFADIFYSIEDSYVGESVNHAGIIATKCRNHPEYGDIILISGLESGGLLIHS